MTAILVGRFLLNLQETTASESGDATGAASMLRFGGGNDELLGPLGDSLSFAFSSFEEGEDAGGVVEGGDAADQNGDTDRLEIGAAGVDVVV